MTTSVVVDSSVAIKWFLPEPLSIQAGRILDRYKTASIRLLAPDLINAEIGNVVWKKHLYQGLAAPDAHSVIDEFRKLTIELTSCADLLGDAYRLAVAHKRTVYDCLYIALSIRSSCQMVTADEKLVNAVGSSVANVIWVANWP